MTTPPTTRSFSTKVSWAASSPPVAPGRWTILTAVPAALPHESQLESRLGWPQGTIAWLRLGFEQRMNRSTGWRPADALPAAARPAAAQAAKWFRRGVGFAPDGAAGTPVAVSGSYEVSVHASAEPPPSVRPRAGEFLLIDANVARCWPGARSDAAVRELEGGEARKTLSMVADILDGWREAGRPGEWLICGGGLVADTAAFAAHLAGARFRFAPTTLLAMADACVGGKTGVNFPPFGKNQVGAFAFPAAVDVWPGWLATLPAREVKAGGAECLKHALLAGDHTWADELAAVLAAGDPAALTPHLGRIISVKAEVVARDPAEAGERAILNLGHTLGHALEAVSQARTRDASTILHGEAVAVGMVYAVVLSRRLRLLPPAVADRILRPLFGSGCVGAPEQVRKWLGGADLRDPATWGALETHIAQDKKAATTSEWVLLGPDGRAARGAQGAWTVAVGDGDRRGAWDELVATLERA